MTSETLWRPSATIDTLRKRAVLLAKVREYFAAEQVLEVETPVLSHFASTDVQLQQWRTQEGLSLHTSPEFAMKRLLAEGIGDIFQIARVFRQDESGHRHNPEFTMLEWYRVGKDEFELMADVVNLIQYLSPQAPLAVRHLTYAEAFMMVGLPDPHVVDTSALQTLTSTTLSADAANWRRDDCLDALMALYVEPRLPESELCFIHQYPASQAALAEHVNVNGVTLARRFELYWRGMELANGYFELTDVEEQRRRFLSDCQMRQTLGLDVPVQDERFLAALDQGLPSCSGVALGLDRLLMILLAKNTIEEVIAFSFDRA